MNSLMKDVLFSDEAKLNMQQHAEASFPDECCGFLYGNENDHIRKITEAIPVLNSKEGDKRRRFEIHPLDYMKAERYAMENGLTFLGIYHSHPQHPAIPSVHDLKQAVPFFSYPILSIMDGKLDHLRSWQLNDNQEFEEERILVPTH